MVCIKHFLEEDVTKSNTLKKGAIPRIFDTNDATESTEEIENEQIQCSTEMPETLYPSDPIDSFPFIASDGVQAAEKNQEKIRLEKENLIERANTTVQLYKLEDKIKTLKATIEKQTANIKRLNTEIKQTNQKNQNLQTLLQQNELEKAAMNAILEVCNVSNLSSLFVQFILIVYLIRLHCSLCLQ